MKGIVLAGGLGTRLRPLTSVTNKHLLPVFDRPMIFWPLEMLAEAGIDEVMIVIGGHSTEEIVKLCQNGRQWGFKSLYYAYQEGEGGIAAALALTKNFVGQDTCCVVLGDNIMLGDSLRPYMKTFLAGHERAMVLAAEVSDPQNYGVPTIEASSKRILFITEKPEVPQSKFGIIGVYFYDDSVFDKIRMCSPSQRGELEITEVNNKYAEERDLAWMKVAGRWLDAGSSIEAWLGVGRAVEEFARAKKHDSLLLEEMNKKG